jgi:EAL domain-containing protein (putative c-di-GMP-specific phosphodiesterase class I)
VSVNLTAGNLAALGLEDFIVSETTASGLTPANVVLEITETAIVEDPVLVTGMLRRLRTRGFRIAIDDFGTGYSSLAYLRDLPVSTLKIDRSFVGEIRSDSDALAIVASIIDLARAIGVTAVAKGVETLDQAALLRELGCQCAQGWLWSPAVALGTVATSGGWTKNFVVGATGPASVAVRRERFRVGPEHGLDRMLSMHAKGASLSTIAASLNADGYFTPKGLRWHGTSVARAVADAAYDRRASSGDAGA